MDAAGYMVKEWRAQLDPQQGVNLPVVLSSNDDNVARAPAGQDNYQLKPKTELTGSDRIKLLVQKRNQNSDQLSKRNRGKSGDLVASDSKKSKPGASSDQLNPTVQYARFGGDNVVQKLEGDNVVQQLDEENVAVSPQLVGGAQAWLLEQVNEKCAPPGLHLFI